MSPGTTATVYVLVRTDLDLADQVVQVGHACFEAGQRFGQSGPTPLLVVLAVGAEAEMAGALEEIRLRGVKAVGFIEPDRGLGLTAACTEPISTPAHKRPLRHRPLWTDPGCR